jgi:erythromycin esterase-like protein
MKWGHLIPMSLLSVAGLLCCGASAQDPVQWIRQNAIPISTVEAGHGFKDLQPLKRVIQDARIVELGEATHGTREFFQLKHRMVELLASQMGFTIFSIEANMPEAYRLNDYVLHGNGDPKELLKGMYFWTWNTQEVLDMILWMRKFNQAGGHLQFTGFDMQTPTLSLDLVRKFVGRHDLAYAEPLEASWKDVLAAGGGQQNGFGVATATFPVAVAAGHHIRFSGYIQTKDVTQGFAGLWWRVDGAPGTSPLAFDNMSNRGPSNTTPWTRYDISLEVPKEARNINFGVLHTGTGEAWFDSLSVEIDGVPYTETSALDLDFEASTPRGFFTGGAGYAVTPDPAVAHTGKQSLHSRFLGAAFAPVVDNGKAVQNCRGVLDRLTAQRSAYLAAGAGAQEADWAIQSARLVLQYVQMKADKVTRDESMAANIQWISDQNPAAKIIVWAHNGHVAYEAAGSKPMGSYLRNTFGKQLINFGFAFNQGSFQSVDMGSSGSGASKGLHDFTVGPAPDGTLDHALAGAGIPLFALDLREIPKEGPVAVWFAQSHRSRSIGSGYSDALAPRLWSETPAPQSFDALLFVETTTAARPN